MPQRIASRNNLLLTFLIPSPYKSPDGVPEHFKIFMPVDERYLRRQLSIFALAHFKVFNDQIDFGIPIFRVSHAATIIINAVNFGIADSSEVL